MSMVERQEADDALLKQWNFVKELFIKSYNELEFDNYFAIAQVSVSQNIIIIGVPTRFVKNHIQAHKEKILNFWKQANPQVIDIQIIIGRAKKVKEVETDASTKIMAEVIQLPLWSDEKRGTPNSALRGSLFSAIHGNQRKSFTRKIICDETNLKIRFTGIQLNQSDLDVWEMALHISRQQNLGAEIYFTANSFLKALGRDTGNSQHEWLKDTFSRLSACSVEITHENKTYFGSLIEGGMRDEGTGEYKIEINTKMIRLYHAGWTAINWEDRHRIGKRPLALWLHGYIASHAKIFPTKVETYYRLSGSENKSMRDFKYNLKKALEHLYELKLIKAFWFTKDLVNIENIPTDLQIKYSQRKKS